MRDSFNNEFLELIGDIHRITFEVRRDLKPENLTQIQYNIMEYLYMHQGVSMGPLAECMYLSLPNASREVRKLVELGLVYKKNDENDKRVTNIYMTEEGQSLIGSTFAGIMQTLNERYQHLADGELNELMEAIMLIRAKLL